MLAREKRAARGSGAASALLTALRAYGIGKADRDEGMSAANRTRELALRKSRDQRGLRAWI